MKKTLKRIGWILFAAIVVFATWWIIKTRLNAPSEEQLKKEKAQDDSLIQGEGGELDKLDKLVSEDVDSITTDTSTIK